MAISFLFPGQGSQFAGMARDLHDEYPEARARIEAADQVLGFSLSAIMFGVGDDAAESLKRTDVTQPALFVHSMAADAVLEEKDIRPAMVAGHSLGEYSALASAGAIGFEDGLRIVRLRGELMARAGDERPGTMAAVIGADDALIERVCDEVSGGGYVVQPANFNSPGQVVISGDVEAVGFAMERLKAEGAKRVVQLPVSGAFHSPLMDYAREGLAEALGELPIRSPVCPVYLNVTARPTRDAEEIRARLLEQLLAPVQWASILRAMEADGAQTYVEVGAGNVLSGLAKRTLGRGASTKAAGSAGDIRALEDVEDGNN